MKGYMLRLPHQAVAEVLKMANPQIPKTARLREFHYSPELDRLTVSWVTKQGRKRKV